MKLLLLSVFCLVSINSCKPANHSESEGKWGARAGNALSPQVGKISKFDEALSSVKKLVKTNNQGELDNFKKMIKGANADLAIETYRDAYKAEFAQWEKTISSLNTRKDLLMEQPNSSFRDKALKDIYKEAENATLDITQTSERRFRQLQDISEDINNRRARKETIMSLARDRGDRRSLSNQLTAFSTSDTETSRILLTPYYRNTSISKFMTDAPESLQALQTRWAKSSVFTQALYKDTTNPSPDILYHYLNEDELKNLTDLLEK